MPYKDDLNPNGFTKVLHWSDVNETSKVTRLNGTLRNVFQELGQLFTKNKIDISKELFEIFKERIKQSGDSEKVRQEWLEFSKQLITETNMRFDNEIFRLRNFQYDRLDWHDKMDFIIRGNYYDTTIRPKEVK